MVSLTAGVLISSATFWAIILIEVLFGAAMFDES